MEQRLASFPVWGGHAVVAAPSADALAGALAVVREITDAFDLACSRFRPDAELARVNRAAGRLTAIGPLLTEALDVALAAAELTGGDLDPTIGTSLIASGYDRDLDALVDRPAPPRVRFDSVPGWRTIALDAAAGTVQLPLGAQLDLGATAKALAADHAAAAAADAVGAPVLVALGGDLATAPGPDGAAVTWRVRVTDDHRHAETPGQWLDFPGGGLATSSSTTRRWRTGSGELHHLLDPRSGRPAQSPFRTVTVAAASCLQANVASATVLLRGERGVAFLEEHGLPARLVTHAGATVYAGDWPREHDELPAAA